MERQPVPGDAAQAYKACSILTVLNNVFRQVSHGVKTIPEVSPSALMSMTWIRVDASSCHMQAALPGQPVAHKGSCPAGQWSPLSTSSLGVCVAGLPAFHHSWGRWAQPDRRQPSGAL